jgi:hypothetical protein
MSEYEPITSDGNIQGGSSNNEKRANGWLIGFIAVVVVVGIAVVAVYLGSSSSDEEVSLYSGDCYTECCTWDGFDYCPGDCIEQDLGEYCPSGPDERPMLRYEFSQNTNAYCNDYSTPAHYYRPALEGPNEKNWIIRFEGGNSCFDPVTCDERIRDDPQMMTTATTKLVFEDPEGGLFNGDPALNPNFHDWNMISGHYCSSDAWSGTSDAEDNDVGIPFKGHEVAIGVFMEAEYRWNLSSADRVIVFGFSAGGIGIMSGSEQIKDWFDENAPNVELFFLMDSSWFLASMEDWGNMTCATQDTCSLSDQMQFGLVNWQPVYSENCAAAGLDWECMIPEYSFQYLTTRRMFFIFQNEYDSMQVNLHTGESVLIDDNWGLQPDSWYVDMANITLQTLMDNVDGFYVSNCENHDNLNRNWWREIIVDDSWGYDKMLDYYDNVYYNGDQKSWTYDEYLNETGGACRACNPTCPIPTEPPHVHWVWTDWE